MADTDPYERFGAVPEFRLASTDIDDGEPLARAFRDTPSGGTNTSPQLSWSGFPADTKSFAITIWDADAPTGSGFWHWAVYNIPASVTSIPQGAGSAGGSLPARALMLKNEYRRREYAGAEPPEGTGIHRYFVIVHAVDVERLDLDPDTTPAVLGFNLHFHTVARAMLVPTASAGDELPDEE